MEILRIREHGEPQRPNRSVAQLAAHLKVDFKPENLSLSMVSLARRVESLEFELQLLRFEVRTRRWWHSLTRRDRT